MSKVAAFESAGDGERRAIVPAGAEFHLGDAADCLGRMAAAGRKFDVVVMDPPWENKHVKREAARRRGYGTMDNGDVGELPVRSLLSDSALLFVWCTASRRHREAVAQWTRAWALEPAAEWTWLKVTRSGEPVVGMDKAHKQPFEFLYVAKSRGFRVPGPVWSNRICPGNAQFPDFSGSV